MSLGLGIDAGGTATRWRLADADGQCVAQGSTDPLSGHLFSPAAEERARLLIAGIAREIGARKPNGIVAGITGLTRDTPSEILVRDMLAGAFDLPAASVFVAEDMWIAYLSYFGLGEGILVYSGTGSIGCYVTTDKDIIRVGGRGNLIDDAGSGFWIAREALKSVLRREEENPGEAWDTPLGRALANRLGGTDWSVVRAYVYGGDRGKIGSLARAVAEAALRSDPVALTILRDAGQELARLANSLIKRAGPHPIALVGGGTRLHPVIAESFRTNLLADVEVLTHDVDAAMTAARLAATVT